MGKILSNLIYRILPLTICLLPVANVFAQNSGIGTPNPTHTLHIKPLEANPVQDPIRIENLQDYNSSTDSMVLVIDPDSGVVRVMPIGDLGGGGTVSNDYDKDPSNELQDASEVTLETPIDLDQDGTSEMSVQEALEALTNTLPKGTYKTIGEARSAGLEDGDSFFAHPQGVLGCGGCIIKLLPGMN